MVVRALSRDDDRNFLVLRTELAEADLLGLPLRIVIGCKGLARGAVEVTERARGVSHAVPAGADIVSRLAGMI